MTWLATADYFNNAGKKSGTAAFVRYIHEGVKITTWSSIANFEGKGALSQERWEQLLMGENSPLTKEDIEAELESPDTAQMLDDTRILAARSIRKAGKDAPMSRKVGRLARDMLSTPDAEGTNYSTEPVGFLTVDPEAGEVCVYQDPKDMVSIASVYPGDHVAMTGGSRTIKDTRWVQVDLGGGLVGWVDEASTNSAGDAGVSEKIKARRSAEKDAKDYSVLPEAGASSMLDVPVGLSVRGFLVTGGRGGAPVYEDVYSSRTIGQLPIGSGDESYWELIPEVGIGDAERFEVLFQGRPGFVEKSMLRRATDLDTMMNADQISSEEMETTRQQLAVLKGDRARHRAYTLRLQRIAPALERKDKASFNHEGNAGQMMALATCLQFLAVPNPYPEHGYTDALEMIRMEKGLPATVGEDGWSALRRGWRLVPPSYFGSRRSLSAAPRLPDGAL